MVTFRESADEFGENAPSFLLKETGSMRLESLDLQWPGNATTEQKRRVLRSMAAATAKGLKPCQITWHRRKTRIAADALVEFMASVDEDIWWLGHVALVFGPVDRPEMIWLPGCDGTFLHIAASETDGILEAVQEISLEIGWTTEAQ